MAPQLRRAAAAARQALIDLAAARWNVEASTVEAANGAVRHAASNRTVSYGGRMAVRYDPAAAVSLEAGGVFQNLESRGGQ